MLWFFLFFIWIWLLITVFADIFRSDDMGAGPGLLDDLRDRAAPTLGVLVYLIAPRQQMHGTPPRDAARQEQQMRDYVQASPAPAGRRRRGDRPPARPAAEGRDLAEEFDGQKLLSTDHARPRRPGGDMQPHDDGATPDLDLVEVRRGRRARAVLHGRRGRRPRELVESARIRILDLVGVVVGPDGRATAVEPEQLPGLAELGTGAGRRAAERGRPGPGQQRQRPAPRR